MTLYKRALFKRFKDKYSPDEVDKLALLIILAFLTLFGIMGCIESYASEDDYEVLDTSSVSGIVITPNSNHFVSNASGGASVGYVQMEKGYIYEITNTSSSSSAIRLAVSNAVPVLNGTYSFLGEIVGGETYSYACYDTSNYLYFDWSWDTSFIVVKRTKIANMDNAVSGLVDNVGVNQIWNIFDVSIEYIVIVVAVAFGIFLIALAIRKVSKGKSEF